MHIFYNPNPCRRFVGDCVVRAITKTENISWYEAYIYLCLFGALYCNMPSGNDIWTAFLLHRGYERYWLSPRKTLKEFCAEHPIGNYVLGTGTHLIAVSDGNYYDSWDSGDELVDRYFKWQYKGE